MNEHAAYQADILKYAQSFLQKYPGGKLYAKIKITFFSIASVIILGQIIMTYTSSDPHANFDADIAWAAVFLLIPITEWSSYKALKRQKTLCAGIVYLSGLNNQK